MYILSIRRANGRRDRDYARVILMANRYRVGDGNSCACLAAAPPRLASNDFVGPGHWGGIVYLTLIRLLCKDVLVDIKADTP